MYPPLEEEEEGGQKKAGEVGLEEHWRDAKRVVCLHKKDPKVCACV